MGAILAGGSVGDIVSFLGETSILTAAITELPLLDHIQTTLPYAGIIAGLSVILFIVIQVVIGFNRDSIIFLPIDFRNRHT
jgi:Na+/H+ antiporter NhaC